MNNRFLQEVADYLATIETEGEEGPAKDEKFVDLMTEKYSLPEDCEAVLCASITYIRSVADLIK